MDIKKETFVDADDITTKSLTFDLLMGLHNKMDGLTEKYDSHLPKCDERFKKLENRKKLDTAVAGSAGVIGGFLAHLAKIIGMGNG